MDKFEYKVSVIVPVYNVEKYLHECIESLLKQTMSYSDIEVLLVDDGSTDSSLKICKKYNMLYPMFKVITKENEGVSKTRNLALKKAKGKYILFLDADDTITNNTLESIYTFFEARYSEIDLVTYPLRKYVKSKGLIKNLHYRYKYLHNTGVYELEKFPYIVQTTMNICVKNENPKEYFDESMTVHEDQDYITRILMKKGTIGFVKECEYHYTQRAESVMNTVSAIDIWSPTIKKYEKVFQKYEGQKIPLYIQALLFNDIKWKLVSDILYPSHLPQDEFEIEIGRLKKLLTQIDVNIILKHPETDIFHKFYWLTMKPNSNLTFINDNNFFGLVKEKDLIYSKEKMELIVYRIMRFNNKTYLLLCSKSPVFSFSIKPVIYAYEYKHGECIKRKMRKFPSAYNYYKTRVKTNVFWTFYYECQIDKTDSVEFKIELDGIIYNASYYFMPQCQLIKKNGLLEYVNQAERIVFYKNKFFFTSIDKIYCDMFHKTCTGEITDVNSEIASLRKIALNMKTNKKIWLYYDCKGVKYDNGYYQFIYDLTKTDNVERYYISDNSPEIIDEVFNEGQKEHVVEFGSFYHKLLFINSDKIITAYIEENNYNPFSNNEKTLLKDLLKYQIIYLQHGILHAHLPWKYSPEKINIDKIVVSSQFEINNFVKNYGFNEKMMIKSGMPRFDIFAKNSTTKKKILFAPTWRKYLIGACINNEWDIREKEFLDSRYYKKIMQLINSKKLKRILEENDIELDLKLHPIFKAYAHLFTKETENIYILDESSDDNEYAMFITDFSSYVFDFAYRNVSILYFLPDKEEFEVGLNGYRELDLPFDEAFGPVMYEADEVVEAIEERMKLNFIPEDKFLKRMKDFYLPMEKSREKIYMDLTNETI